MLWMPFHDDIPCFILAIEVTLFLLENRFVPYKWRSWAYHVYFPVQASVKLVELQHISRVYRHHRITESGLNYTQAQLETNKYLWEKNTNINLYPAKYFRLRLGQPTSPVSSPLSPGQTRGFIAAIGWNSISDLSIGLRFVGSLGLDSSGRREFDSLGFSSCFKDPNLVQLLVWTWLGSTNPICFLKQIPWPTWDKS